MASIILVLKKDNGKILVRTNFFFLQKNKISIINYSKISKSDIHAEIMVLI